MANITLFTDNRCLDSLRSYTLCWIVRPIEQHASLTICHGLLATLHTHTQCTVSISIKHSLVLFTMQVNLQVSHFWKHIPFQSRAIAPIKFLFMGSICRSQVVWRRESLFQSITALHFDRFVLQGFNWFTIPNVELLDFKLALCAIGRAAKNGIVQKKNDKWHCVQKKMREVSFILRASR